MGTSNGRKPEKSEKSGNDISQLEKEKKDCSNELTEAELVALRSTQTVKWSIVIILVTLQVYFLLSLPRITKCMWQTWLWGVFTFHWHTFGELGGAHRLWSHRSFKARLPMKIFLVLGHLLALHYSIYEWARDHRVHHKYTDTDADPYNSNRGFFFSHAGWLVMKKHPEVIRRGKEIDLSDLEKDPIVMFERKYHWPMAIGLNILTFVIPVVAWNETWRSAFDCFLLRAFIGSHGTSSINSLAHLYGTRPFNKSINPAENPLVSILSGGEGWHNFHHVFPWDYRAADVGFLNANMHLIRLGERLGIAYDLKTASPALVARVARRFGDGSRADFLERAPEVPPEAARDPSLVDALPPARPNALPLVTAKS